MYRNKADEIILNALREDTGNGDVTTESCVPEGAVIRGEFIAKEPGFVSGLAVAARVFELVDERVRFEALKECTAVGAGELIAIVSGNARAILTAERTALNLLQRMSGIATETSRAVAAVAGTGAMITDTRKTMPGLRYFDKLAVRLGGGRNHRYNLADGVLIKDNHIAAAGGIAAAVKAARAVIPHTLKIEVETESQAEVAQALEAGADIIMLDNMSIEEMRTAVKYVAGRALCEASGNMGTRNLREVAETGVDIISIGALTHSVKAMDISLKFRT